MDAQLARPDRRQAGTSASAVHSRLEPAPRIDFVETWEFSELTEEVATTPAVDLQVWQPIGDQPAPADAPPYIAALYEIPLLTAAGEAFLFRKMNYLRFRAHRLQVDTDHVDASVSGRIDELLEASESVRNQIVEANLRLVVSIARRFAGPRGNFDELVSEGNMILLKAVRKFDYSRGYRFSTYLTHSVQRHLSRHVQRITRRAGLESTIAAGALERCAPGRSVEPNATEAHPTDATAVVERIRDCLNDREQYVIRERFGLGRGGATKTLQRLADELGVCKERVRQIHHAALKKLRRLAEQAAPHVASA